MRQIAAALIAFFLLTGGGGAEPPVKGEALVRDAVTVAVAGARFRLAGITPPENGRCGGTSCDDAAVAVIGSRLAGQDVTCAKERRLGHGYFLGQCKLPDGADLAELILEEGLAKPDANAPPAYAAASERAKANGRGLWGR